jgi:hypothetical protein
MAKSRSKKRGRGLAGTPVEHLERGRTALNWATGHLREARAAKTCGARVHHAISVLDSAAEYREEMKWAGRERPLEAADAIATAASLRKQAIELINRCVVVR